MEPEIDPDTGEAVTVHNYQMYGCYVAAALALLMIITICCLYTKIRIAIKIM